MRDKVIWLGCVLLFAAGVIAGKMSGAADFFKVDNIHDLFEISGSVATLVAAVVAIRALGDWRSEFLFSEKYKAIRDFHAACRNDMAAYWYVVNGYGLLPDVWNHRDSSDWFRNETECYNIKMSNSHARLNRAFMMLRHYTSDEDFEIVSEAYDKYIDAASRGWSELMTFAAECRLMVEEPTERYQEFWLLGDRRRNLVFEATTELEVQADELLAKYTRAVRK